LLCLAAAALARNLDGRFAQLDPASRQWLRSQQSPKTGGNCCNEADGEYAEEDIRGGHFWTRWPRGNGKWHQVPDDVVIHDPNRNGAPVVWWYLETNSQTGEHELKIRCYAPGPLG
jgi:hypothetical protein